VWMKGCEGVGGECAMLGVVCDFLREKLLWF
jgi:hypothetical protein